MTHCCGVFYYVAVVRQDDVPEDNLELLKFVESDHEGRCAKIREAMTTEEIEVCVAYLLLCTQSPLTVNSM